MSAAAIAAATGAPAGPRAGQGLRHGFPPPAGGRAAYVVAGVGHSHTQRSIERHNICLEFLRRHGDRWEHFGFERYHEFYMPIVVFVTDNLRVADGQYDR